MERRWLGPADNSAESRSGAWTGRITGDLTCVCVHSIQMDGGEAWSAAAQRRRDYSQLRVQTSLAKLPVRIPETLRREEEEEERSGREKVRCGN